MLRMSGPIFGRSFPAPPRRWSGFSSFDSVSFVFADCAAGWCRKAAEREIGGSSGTVDDDVESGCAGKAMVCFRVPSMFAPGISIVC